MDLNKSDVIKKLCKLVSTVGNEKFECNLPADCFCRDMAGFRVDDEVIKFIEQAVNKEIKDQK